VWTRRRFLQTSLALGLGTMWPAAGGCSHQPSLQAIHDALDSLRNQRVTLPPLAGHREFRGVVHAHTGLSHDSTGTVEELLSAARSAKLDFLVTTDHYTPRIFTEGLQGSHGAVLVVRGVEVALGCTRQGGLLRRCASVLAIGLREPLKPRPDGQWDWDDLFRTIRGQGALAVIAHPRGMMNSSYYRYADGMEIYDLADTMRERLVDVPRYLLDLALDRTEHREELFMQLVVERSNWNLVAWDRFLQTRRFVGLGGNDAHQSLSVMGLHLDPYDLVFRAVNTHVLAPSLSPKNLVEALRAGRCFTAFNLLADGAGFQFVVRDGDGGSVVGLMGDEVPMEDGLVLVAQSPIPGVLELLRDGVPIRRLEGRNLRYAVDRPGVYRMEVSLQVVDRRRPWIFSNPIYVRA